jgi:hypothetical protein
LGELDRFVSAFSKAIRGEMESMRKQLGSFEIPLGSGQLLDNYGENTSAYRFVISSQNEKLHPGLECTLRSEKSEFLVQINQVSALSIDLSCSENLPLANRAHVLVIYPWFLYEKLLSTLDNLRDADSFYIDSAMRLFGKRPPTLAANEKALLQNPELNPSQLSAIDLCCRSDLAFVWGPPGTGKTSTLAPILAEMLHRGYRTLVTSTTNIAVDQALDKLLESPIAQRALLDHRIIRIGQSGGTTDDVGLHTVTAQRSKDTIDRMHALQEKCLSRLQQLASCKNLLSKLTDASDEEQMNLFADEKPRRSFANELKAIYPLGAGGHLKNAPQAILHNAIERRYNRLHRLVDLCQERIEQMRQHLRRATRKTLERAQLVFSTMSGAYLNNLLSDERFDVVVIEEAGMAVLPTLFYCAALARKKVIAVGDPRQLPPIVQSREAFVHRAMGRNIFDVTVPEPLKSDCVALLDTQYRMHPAIGDLVSDLYYEGRLRNDVSTQSMAAITNRPPFSQAPLVLFDTRGQTQCQTTGRHSRINEASAQLAAELALCAFDAGIQSIGVITPYNEQAKLIRHRMRDLGLKNDCAESSTVHRFQGQERDLIILDTTDAAPLKPGILLNGPGASANLLNVSLSRARGKLIVIADVSYFFHGAANGPISRLLQTMKQVGCGATMDTPRI